MALKRELLETTCESRKLPRVEGLLAALPQSDQRDLLLDALPHAAKAGGEKRHSFQTEVLNMTGELLKIVHSTAIETRTRFEAQAAEAKTKSDTVAETFAACKQRQERTALERDGCAAMALQAEEAHANAEYEQSRSETARSCIMEERNKLEAEKANSEMFLENRWEGMDVKLVQEQLSTIGAEPALIAAVPGALAVPLEQRGSFDSLTTTALTASLKERAETVDSLLSRNQQEEKTAASFALGAWAFAEMAKEQAVSAAEKVAESEKLLDSVTTELGQCSASVNAQEKVLQAALSEQTLAMSVVIEIESGLEELQHVKENDQPVVIVPEPSLEKPSPETDEVPAINLAKNEDLPAHAVISPESISVGGC